MTSPRAKLVSDRYWPSLVLDNGPPERPWPNPKSMCFKAAWFRDRNSVDRSVAASPLASASTWRAGTRRSTVIRTRWMQGEETRQWQTSICTFRRHLRHARPEVSRWITYLAGSSSSWELRAGSTGPTVKALPWLQTALKRWEIVSAKLKIETVGLCPYVRNDKMMSVVRAHEGEISCPSYLGPNWFSTYMYYMSGIGMSQLMLIQRSILRQTIFRKGNDLSIWELKTKGEMILPCFTCTSFNVLKLN